MVVNPYSKTVGLPVPSNFATVYHLFFQYKSTHWTTVLMDLLQCHTQSYESVQNETARANYQAVNETGTHYLAALVLATSTGDTTGGDDGQWTEATGDDQQEPLETTSHRSHWR